MTSALAQRLHNTEVAAGGRPNSVLGWLNADSTKGELAKALPRSMDSARYLRIVQTEIRKNPALLEADLASFVLGVLNLAALGLEPGPLGHAYLTGPFRNSKTGKKEVVPIVGYKGLQDLAFRGGTIDYLDAVAVHEGEPFRIRRGTDPVIEHEELPDCAENLVVAYYAIAIPKGGGRAVFEVMWPQDVEAIRKRSRAAEVPNSPWKTDPEPMSLKTVMRRLLNRGKVRLSAEAARAAKEDEDRELGLDRQTFDVGPLAIEGAAEVVPEPGPEADPATEPASTAAAS